MNFNFPNNYKIIFISYSWDNEDHKLWVLKQAKALEEKGFNIIIDRTHLRPGMHSKLFMRVAIEQSDIVLIVLTPEYAEKAKNRKGGAGFEYAVINNNMIMTIDENEKYIPILRSGDYSTSVPEFFQPFIYCDMRDDALFDNKIQELADTINKKPITLDSLISDDSN